MIARAASAGVFPHWVHVIEFESIEPAHNRYRAYRITLMRDLWGSWILIRSWGRIGKRQRINQTIFGLHSEASTVAQAIMCGAGTEDELSTLLVGLATSSSAPV